MAKKKTAVASAKQISPETPSVKTSKKTAKKTTKKAAKRTAKRKAAPKKAAGKHGAEQAAKAAAMAMQDIIARARDHFRQAPQEQVFYLIDGKQLADLRDLVEALDEMAEHTFGHHVTGDRHDFASWVQEVLQERALADELRAAEPHPRAHQHVIYRHIVRRTW